MERKDAESLFNRAKNLKALIIGDLMLDEYLWGKAARISPEAPVPVVDVKREELRLGGAGNVANNMVAMGFDVSLCSVIGADENGSLLRRVFTGKGVDLDGVFEDPLRMTSKKTRVLAANQQIVRIDRETKVEIAVEFEDKIVEFLAANSTSWDIILVSDYLKGVLTTKVLDAVINVGRRQGIPVVVDPKGNDFSKYRAATIITPNCKEAEIASHIPITDEKSLNAAATWLLEAGEYDAVLITRSAEGMSLYINDGTVTHLPTVAR
ncbi:MAG: PfkB family carbohydrate kinase, partial [Deltaproteobacteria bacterium]